MTPNRSKLKVLFVAHRIPYPPDKGDKIRSYHILKYLCERYEVHLACLCDDQRDWQRRHDLSRLTPNYYVQKITPLRQRIQALAALFRGEPMSVAAFQSRRFWQYLRRLCSREEFDVVYVFSSNAAIYARELRAPLKIVDFCDLDSIKFREFSRKHHWPMNVLSMIEFKRLHRYEKEIAQAFHYVVFVNELERQLFPATVSNGKFKVISNGVELKAVLKSVRREYAFPEVNNPYVIFLGMMKYYPNVEAAEWFATRVFPRLKVLIPELEFYIVGKNPPAKIRRLHNPRVGIYVTGYVDQIDLLLSRATAFVAPIKTARGVQTKILEAMSHCVPVITTPDAARALGAFHGRELLIAESESEFVHAFLSLFYDPQLRQRIVNGALNLLNERFDWEANLALLSEIIESNDPARGRGAPGFREPPFPGMEQ